MLLLRPSETIALSHPFKLQPAGPESVLIDSGATGVISAAILLMVAFSGNVPLKWHQESILGVYFMKTLV